MTWDGCRVLITGGSGFIGQHLAASLCAQGAEVVIADIEEPRHSNYSEFKCVDITETDKLPELVNDIDCIFHLAAKVSVQDSIAEPEANFAVNYSATKNLLEQAVDSGIKAFLFASSAAVYGDPKYLPVDEKHSLSPLSPYGEAKGHSDLLVQKMGQLIPTAALRLFNVYGPFQSDASPYSGVIALFRKRTLAGDNLIIFGDGSSTRDFIHVDDVVLAFTTCAEQLLMEGKESPCCGSALNICTGESTTIADLADLCIELADGDSEIETRPSRDGDIAHSSGSSAKIQSLLNWSPEVPLEHGLLGIL